MSSPIRLVSILFVALAAVASLHAAERSGKQAFQNAWVGRRVVVKRALYSVVFSTDGTGLSVSDNDFRFINAAYDAQFNSFSPIRTFSAIGSPESRVDFFVAGTQTPAVSTGFGVVFSDVDQLGSASIKLLGVNGNSLGVYQAPPCPEGFSFVGVQFPTPLVAAIDIQSGHGPLGSDAADVSDRDHGPARDLVIMDDFIYGEPRAIR